VNRRRKFLAYEQWAYIRLENNNCNNNNNNNGRNIEVSPYISRNSKSMLPNKATLTSVAVYCFKFNSLLACSTSVCFVLYA